MGGFLVGALGVCLSCYPRPGPLPTVLSPCPFCFPGTPVGFCGWGTQAPVEASWAFRALRVVVWVGAGLRPGPCCVGRWRGAGGGGQARGGRVKSGLCSNQLNT